LRVLCPGRYRWSDDDCYCSRHHEGASKSF
jgi:hypothetical protein